MPQHPLSRKLALFIKNVLVLDLEVIFHFITKVKNIYIITKHVNILDCININWYLEIVWRCKELLVKIHMQLLLPPLRLKISQITFTKLLV